MTSPLNLNELSAAEDPARPLLERLGYVPGEERANEREVLLSAARII